MCAGANSNHWCSEEFPTRSAGFAPPAALAVPPPLKLRRRTEARLTNRVRLERREQHDDRARLGCDLCIRRSWELLVGVDDVVRRME